MRHSNTERIGVNETERIVINDLGWIFREQSIDDFGIDAIIEQVIDGNPTAKLIGVQIKTGKSNFHWTEKHLVYYTTHIHYNYWLNANIPIIFVAHIPESSKTYWEHITYRNFQKTKKNLKFQILRNQEFNNRSVKQLNQIINPEQDRYLFRKADEKTISNYIDDIVFIRESEGCVKGIINQLEKLSKLANQYNLLFVKFQKENLNDNDFIVKSSINNLAKELNTIAISLDKEIIDFSESYAKGFYAFEKVASTEYLLSNDQANLTIAISSFKNNFDAIKEGLSSFTDLKNSINTLPEKYISLKKAKFRLLEVFELIINEFIEASKISSSSSVNLEKLLSK